MRPTSSRSLCLPPARAHFCTSVARRNGGTSSPMKYGLNGTIPATVNSTVGSCGIRLADGTTVWSRSAKKPVNDRRSSLAVVGGEAIVAEPTGSPSKARSRFQRARGPVSGLPSAARSVAAAQRRERRRRPDGWSADGAGVAGRSGRVGLAVDGARELLQLADVARAR